MARVARDGPVSLSNDGFADAASANGDHTIETDVLVIGGGFSGITAMHRLRNAGLRAKCFESGSAFGGVWHWNRYPGARVDSEFPFYQLNIPEVYRTWHFSQRFPDHQELRRYISHVDKVLDLSKDTYFDARVVDATWSSNGRWTIKTQQGQLASGKYLILCTGLHSRTYTPDFPGLSKYKGEILHPSVSWPRGWAANGKKIGLIGAGATSVQITQELGKEDGVDLTIFLRRPSYNLPMKQRDLSATEQIYQKHMYGPVLDACRKTPGGFAVTLANPNKATKTSEADRERLFESLWDTGGLNFLIGNYIDTVFDQASNRIVYEYWRKRVCQRLKDPSKQMIMAPADMPFYFGTRRTPLEHDYYEVLDRPNVHLHDLQAISLRSFSERGLVMADDKEHFFDAVILATGFDSFTGSLTQMGLKNKDGIDIKDLWSDGVHTYLGLTVSGFPNMFMSYTVHAPTARANGTTLIEAQVETIVDMITKLESEGAKSIEPTPKAEQEWKSDIDEANRKTLFPFTNSWWNGSNIPGKKVENLTYVAGIGDYEAKCRATLDGWKGFIVQT